MIQLSLFDAVPILLTQDKIATVDACNSDLLNLNWYALNLGKKFYATRIEKGNKRIYLHRLVMERKLGRALLRSEDIDHIDGDGLNNLYSNLRIASRSQNKSNVGLCVRNKSGYKGVCAYRGRWRASITVNGRTIFLGDHETPELAHRAYCKAAIEYYGEFARFA